MCLALLGPISPAAFFFFPLFLPRQLNLLLSAPFFLVLYRIIWLIYTYPFFLAVLRQGLVLYYRNLFFLGANFLLLPDRPGLGPSFPFSFVVDYSCEGFCCRFPFFAVIP